MPLAAPLRVPVELARVSAMAAKARGQASERWFRLAHEVSVEELVFASDLGAELEGPIALAFHLPGDERPVRGTGKAVEVVVGDGHDERAERRLIRFVDLDEDGPVRIESYVKERLGILP